MKLLVAAALLLAACEHSAPAPGSVALPPHLRVINETNYDLFRDFAEFVDEEHNARCWVVVYHGEGVSVSCMPGPGGAR